MSSYNAKRGVSQSELMFLKEGRTAGRGISLSSELISEMRETVAGREKGCSISG